VIRKYAARCAVLDGEYWECGVLDGESATLFSEHATVLRLFDSFEGLPRQTLEDFNPNPNIYRMFKGDEQKVKERFPYAYVHTGWIPETFRGLENKKIAFAHIDLDLYSGTRAALRFIAPRIMRGGVIVVDDYSDTEWVGVKRAVDEFNLNPFVEVLHQCVIQL
jgi:hypothetical protein